MPRKGHFCFLPQSRVVVRSGVAAERVGNRVRDFSGDGGKQFVNFLRAEYFEETVPVLGSKLCKALAQGLVKKYAFSSHNQNIAAANLGETAPDGLL
jgi:hypothetical protein